MREEQGQYYSKVTAKGQVTLPAELRQRLGIGPGDLVEVRPGQGEDGPVIEVRRRLSLIEATAGMARPKSPYRPPEWHEIEELVKDGVAQRLYQEMSQ